MFTHVFALPKRFEIIVLSVRKARHSEDQKVPILIPTDSLYRDLGIDLTTNYILAKGSNW